MTSEANKQLAHSPTWIGILVVLGPAKSKAFERHKSILTFYKNKILTTAALKRDPAKNAKDLQLFSWLSFPIPCKHLIMFVTLSILHKQTHASKDSWSIMLALFVLIKIQKSTLKYWGQKCSKESSPEPSPCLWASDQSSKPAHHGVPAGLPRYHSNIKSKQLWNSKEPISSWNHAKTC